MLQQLGIFAQSKDKAGTKNHAKIPNIFDFIYRMNNRDPTIPKISRIKQKKRIKIASGTSTVLVLDYSPSFGFSLGSLDKNRFI